MPVLGLGEMADRIRAEVPDVGDLSVKAMRDWPPGVVVGAEANHDGVREWLEANLGAHLRREVRTFATRQDVERQGWAVREMIRKLDAAAAFVVMFSDDLSCKHPDGWLPRDLRAARAQLIVDMNTFTQAARQWLEDNDMEGPPNA